MHPKRHHGHHKHKHQNKKERKYAEKFRKRSRHVRKAMIEEFRKKKGNVVSYLNECGTHCLDIHEKLRQIVSKFFFRRDHMIAAQSCESPLRSSASQRPTESINIQGSSNCDEDYGSSIEHQEIIETATDSFYGHSSSSEEMQSHFVQNCKTRKEKHLHRKHGWRKYKHWLQKRYFKAWRRCGHQPVMVDTSTMTDDIISSIQQPNLEVSEDMEHYQEATQGPGNLEIQEVVDNMRKSSLD